MMGVGRVEREKIVKMIIGWWFWMRATVGCYSRPFMPLLPTTIYRVIPGSPRSSYSSYFSSFQGYSRVIPGLFSNYSGLLTIRHPNPQAGQQGARRAG